MANNGTKMINKRLCWIAAAAFVMSGGAASAASVQCPDPAVAGINLYSVDTTPSSSCWDYDTTVGVPPTPINPNQPVGIGLNGKLGVADGIRVAGYTAGGGIPGYPETQPWCTDHHLARFK